MSSPSSPARAEEPIAHVIITLTSFGRDPIEFPCPLRQVKLTRSNNTLLLGRASKSENKPYIPGTKNGWFVGAVMSRNHAEIVANLDDKVVSIRDLQSLHGTFINNEGDPIQKDTLRALQNGDQITFGTTILRGSETFEPASVTFRAEFADSNMPGPIIYCVDDIDSSEDESVLDEDLLAVEQVLSSTPVRTAENDDEPVVVAGPIPSAQGLGGVVDLTVEPVAEVEEIPSPLLPGMDNGIDPEPDHLDDSPIGPESPRFSPESPSFASPYASTSEDDGTYSISLTDSEVDDENDSDECYDCEYPISSDAEDLEEDEDDFGPWHRPLTTPPYFPPTVGPITPAVLKASMPEEPRSSDKPGQCTLAAILNPTQEVAMPLEQDSGSEPVITAETLGLKSGKMAYFAAREENKILCTSQPNESSDDHVKGPTGPTPKLDSGPVVDHHEAAPVHQGETRLDEGAPANATSASALLESGQRFLNSPPDHDPLATSPPIDDDIAMMSANAFREHKVMGAQSQTTSMKRKAGEISGADEIPAAQQSVDPGCIEPVAQANVIDRAPKRLKTKRSASNTAWTIAEKVGYAALGGVVVLSSLIYTAPSFA